MKIDDIKQIEIEAEFQKAVSYYMIVTGTSPVSRLYVKNTTEEDIEDVRVEIISEPAFTVPFCVETTLPRLSTIKFEPENLLSPLFTVALNARTQGRIVVRVSSGKRVLGETEAEVAVLAYGECDFSSHPDSLAAFVSPSSALRALSAKADRKLAEWNRRRAGFYDGASKNDVRNYFAAVYAVLGEQSLTRAEQSGDDVILASAADVLKSKTASGLELALLTAALLENAGIHATFGRCSGEWYVGAFLTDDCFGETVIDEPSAVENRLGRGVNELSIVGVKGLFEGENFESNERRTPAEIKTGFDFFVDLFYARISGIRPLPERVALPGGGYDLKEAEDYFTAAPKKIEEIGGDLGGDKTVTREKQWERRLLDLDMRNPLLNFKPSSYAAPVLTARLDDFIDAAASSAEFEIRAIGEEEKTLASDLFEPFNKETYIKPVRDLISYEYRGGRLLAALSGKDFDRAMTAVYRKEKSRLEETGTPSLYLAAGFVQWNRDDEEPRYAPLLLYPASLTRKGSAQPSYRVTINEDEVHVNTTLLEYLYGQFDIDLRGLADFAPTATAGFSAAIARIKQEVAGRKGWTFYDSVYLASMSFSGYLMWKDVHDHVDEFRKNKLIRSLLSGMSEFAAKDDVSGLVPSDEAYAEGGEIILPISADSSQYSAVVDSLDKSFVLHGPPGTGKSQTITNIIANNLAAGKRVLFVAEKAAALDVVARRLKDIGIGDFCLELYSEKTKKTEVAEKLVGTMSLAGTDAGELTDERRGELTEMIERLGGEMHAMHDIHPIGFSVYEAVLGYLDNRDAPDCLTIDSLFYEKLTRESFAKYLSLLTELVVRAKECGDLERSPFKGIGKFDYSEKWRIAGESVLKIYERELKTLRFYARALTQTLNMRTASLTPEKTKGLYEIAKLIGSSPAVTGALDLGREGLPLLSAADTLIALGGQEKRLKKDFAVKWGEFPSDAFDSGKVVAASVKQKDGAKIAKKYAASVRCKLQKEDTYDYFNDVLRVASTVEEEKKRIAALSVLGCDTDEKAKEYAADLAAFTRAGESIYADFDPAVFFESARFMRINSPYLYLGYYADAYERVERTRAEFRRIFAISPSLKTGEIGDELDRIALIARNLDRIGGWCRYQSVADECRRSGFEFVLEPLSLGEITPDDVLSCFKKCVYYNFVRSEIALDDRLCQFSGLALEETIERFRAASDEYERLVRADLYRKLVANIPAPHADGDHNLEKVVLLRAVKNGVKGITLRKLFTLIPTIMKFACPCMLMSPSSVTQFLDLGLDKFDLVVFDEASQVQTCKAVGTIARADRVIVVGDPKQLPPTSFFGADFRDDEHLETEDLESILDDCLAVGMPERRLTWHYRSHHESLIAFSNANFYDNGLLTFPSPSEKDGRVSLCYVDGVYERGGAKHNKREAQELVRDVISRLKNPALAAQSVGVVTFNTAQQAYIEDALGKAIAEHGLESVAYERDEPIFVKNLENVQGDERDVILFSVGYGPDKDGKLSLNFGPLNQAGGERRLNVAASRARVEMKVFSSIKANMIDLNRVSGKGVKSLKAFLEYAERGREMLAVDYRNAGEKKKGLGEHIALELAEKGVKCDYDLGVSDFKIDVAVVDPRDPKKYILAVVCDGENENRIPSVRDRVAMSTRILKTLGWNVYHLWTVNYLGNPRREIARIKDAVAAIVGSGSHSKKTARETLNKYRKTYRRVTLKPLARAGADYALDEANADAIKNKAEAIIAGEGPVREDYVVSRLGEIYSVPPTTKKARARLIDLVRSLSQFARTIDDETWYAQSDPVVFRPLDEKYDRDISDVCPRELAVAVRCAVEQNGSLDRAGLVKAVSALMNCPRRTPKVVAAIGRALELAVSEGLVIPTVEGNYTV